MGMMWCGAPEGEGQEADQAETGALEQGRGDSDAPFARVSVGVGGGVEPGQRLAVDEIFKAGDLVDVSGTTIGKGFQGGIKQHNFKRGLMTHGSKSHRALGSIGAGTTPGRVHEGKKMPGRMGGTRRKIRKLKVVKIDNERRLVMIKGAVPGKPKNLLCINQLKIVVKNIPKN